MKKLFRPIIQNAPPEACQKVNQKKWLVRQMVQSSKKPRNSLKSENEKNKINKYSINKSEKFQNKNNNNCMS